MTGRFGRCPRCGDGDYLGHSQYVDARVAADRWVCLPCHLAAQHEHRAAQPPAVSADVLENARVFLARYRQVRSRYRGMDSRGMPTGGSQRTDFWQPIEDKKGNDREEVQAVRSTDPVGAHEQQQLDAA